MLVIQAGDGIPMTVKYPAGKSPLAHEAAAVAAFKDCLALIKRENQAAVIFNLIYTVDTTHKLELYYALRGRKEISPMGTVVYEYASLDLFKACMLTDFAGLEHPL